MSGLEVPTYTVSAMLSPTSAGFHSCWQGRNRASDGHRPVWFPMDRPYHPCNIWIPPSRPFLLLPVLVVPTHGLVRFQLQSHQGSVKGIISSQQSNEKTHSRPPGEKTSCFSAGNTVSPSVGDTPISGWKESLEGMPGSEASAAEGQRSREPQRKAPLTPTGYLDPAVPEASLPLKFQLCFSLFKAFFPLRPQDTQVSHFH